MIFTISNVGDAKECYISRDSPNLATNIRPDKRSVDWAKRFEYWFITGVAICVCNSIVFTVSTIAKLKANASVHATF